MKQGKTTCPGAIQQLIAAWPAMIVGASLLALTSQLTACAPTVKVATPSEPITINLNVKIEHEIRVKVEQDLEEVFAEDSELF